MKLLQSVDLVVLLHLVNTTGAMNGTLKEGVAEPSLEDRLAKNLARFNADNTVNRIQPVAIFPPGLFRSFLETTVGKKEYWRIL